MQEAPQVKVGIIGAMEVEVATLKAAMDAPRTVERAGMTFVEGTLEGTPAVVVRCGVGKVNAALCVQVLADEFAVSCVVNTGVAGSLDATLDIGDIVVATEARYHDVDATAIGYARGTVPGLPVAAFPADPALVAAAVEACSAVNPGVRVVEGTVVSGDVFVAGRAVKDAILANFPGSSCTEMEGAAIAHAAWLNGLPFAVVRAISDKADDSAHMDYPTFEAVAARHCARMVAELVRRLGARA
jgi:adenosylhomocysteine nucleosidase